MVVINRLGSGGRLISSVYSTNVEEIKILGYKERLLSTERKKMNKMNFPEFGSHLSLRISIAIAIILGFQLSLSKKASQTNEYVISAEKLNQSIQKWQFVPGSIADGESLKVTRDNQKQQIVLCGIDSPPPTQSSGIEARNYLRSLVTQGDGTIFVTPLGKDNQGNTVAELFVLIDERKAVLLNSQMIASGHALRLKTANCPNQKGLIIAEKAAQKRQ
jgi:endonuclease YncB( thermonuclease family)